MKTDKQTSGIFPLPESEEGFYTNRQKPCFSNDHNPPMHLSIPAGFGYRHVCPSCGKVTILKSNAPVFGVQ